MSQAQSLAQITAFNAYTRMPFLAAVAVRFAVAVIKWDQRRSTRRSLKSLEPHLLKDIGLTPQAARREAAKPFWRD